MNLYDIVVKTIDGEDLKLEAYRNHVLLIVNVASQCAFTSQYSGLEELYKRYKEKGLEILGFPCNQFGKQEPGDEAAIKNFCSLKYAVTFPMFKKIDVNGPTAHALYQHLKTEKPGSFFTTSIKWNFTKFLVGRNGAVIARYGPATSPARLERDVVAALSSS